MQSSGNDQYAVQYGNVQPENLSVVFKDAETREPRRTRAARSAASTPTPATTGSTSTRSRTSRSARPWRSPSTARRSAHEHRRRLRRRLRRRRRQAEHRGRTMPRPGSGTPSSAQQIPATGDPELAKKLIAESGEPPRRSSSTSPTPRSTRRPRRSSSTRSARPGSRSRRRRSSPASTTASSSTPRRRATSALAGWGADWPNASTVIPPLLTQKGGWDLSQLDDPAFNAEVEAALTELDRAKQATLWQALNKEAAENVYTLPTFFGLSQTIAGTEDRAGLPLGCLRLLAVRRTVRQAVEPVRVQRS